MKKKSKSELYFEEIGSNFDQWMSIYDVEQRVNLINRWLPVDALKMSCLEVGCGTGRISKAIAPFVNRLTICDISHDLAKEVGEKLSVNWMKQDACNLNINNGSFDIVISSECIEHTPKPKQALSELARVVKKGGAIIVTSPNKLWYPLLWLTSVTKIRKFAGNENWLFPWEAVRVLNNNGITDIKVGGCHLFPWQIPLAKHVLPFFDKFDRLLYPLMINYGICGRKSD